MNTDEHPDTGVFKAYLQNSESPDYATVRLHLARCPACRDEVDSLSSLTNNYMYLDDASDVNETLRDEDHQLISEYVDGNLKASERLKVEALINDNKYAMKSALHYANHSSAMARGLSTHTQDHRQTIAANVQHHTATRLSRVLSYLTQWLDVRAPVWAAVPATAFAVAVVIFSIQSYDSQPVPDANGNIVITGYQDNPVMQFRSTDTLPGIGFFSKADNYSSEYSDVQISVLDNGDSTASKLKLQWPEVKNAAQYSMRLQVFNQGQKIPLGEISTETATVIFDLEKISPNNRYEWILTGRTRDKKTFYSTGGFVISEKQ